MSDRNQLKDRARDELFSHINRCGVLRAAHEDQEHWLDETMDYLGERYPDLADTDLRELRTLGLTFCRPAIRNGNEASDSDSGSDSDSDEGETVTAAADDSSAV